MESAVVKALDITASMTGVTTAATSVMSWITSDEFLSIIFVGGCITGVAFRFIRNAIKTSKR